MKPKRKITKIKQTSNSDGFFKSVLVKTLDVSPKKVFITKGSKNNHWEARIYLKSYVTSQLLNHLVAGLNKSNIKLIKGTSSSTYDSGFNNALSLLEIEFKYIKQWKTPTKPSRLKIKAEVQMGKTEILANSIGQGLKLNTAIKNIYKQAVQQKIVADDLGTFKVLKYGDSARDGMETFKKYISERDYSNFLPFMKWLDDGLYKFRGNQEINLDEIDDEEDEAPRGRGKKKGSGKSFAVKPKRSVAPRDTQEDGEEGVKQEPSVVISSITAAKAAIRLEARKKALGYLTKAP